MEQCFQRCLLLQLAELRASDLEQSLSRLTREMAQASMRENYWGVDDWCKFFEGLGMRIEPTDLMTELSAFPWEYTWLSGTNSSPDSTNAESYFAYQGISRLRDSPLDIKRWHQTIQGSKHKTAGRNRGWYFRYQDPWYLREEMANETLREQWYMVLKEPIILQNESAAARERDFKVIREHFFYQGYYVLTPIECLTYYAAYRHRFRKFPNPNTNILVNASSSQNDQCVMFWADDEAMGFDEDNGAGEDPLDQWGVLLRKKNE